MVDPDESEPEPATHEPPSILQYALRRLTSEPAQPEKRTRSFRKPSQPLATLDAISIECIWIHCKAEDHAR